MKLFHVAALSHFTYALYYNFVFVAPLEMKLREFEFGGPFVYLTILASVSWSKFKQKNFLINRVIGDFFKVIQVIFYATALLNDVAPATGLTRLKDYIFATLALPLALETSLMYWALVKIDRELAFPKALDAFFPRWLDLALHTNVSIFILLGNLLIP